MDKKILHNFLCLHFYSSLFLNFELSIICAVTLPTVDDLNPWKSCLTPFSLSFYLFFPLVSLPPMHVLCVSWILFVFYLSRALFFESLTDLPPLFFWWRPSPSLSLAPFSSHTFLGLYLSLLLGQSRQFILEWIRISNK